jgi:hypothetical protein
LGRPEDQRETCAPSEFEQLTPYHSYMLLICGFKLQPYL